MRLKKVTIYFTEEEYAVLQAIVDDEEATPQRGGAGQTRSGLQTAVAPKGNANRRIRAKADPQGRTGKIGR